jgi:hypothetical protein
MAKDNKHWLVRTQTIAGLWLVFLVILALTLVAELFVHAHGHFGIDGTFAFNAWYGFGVCVAMIVVAKILGIFLKRKDTYYGQ